MGLEEPPPVTLTFYSTVGTSLCRKSPASGESDFCAAAAKDSEAGWEGGNPFGVLCMDGDGEQIPWAEDEF